MYVGVILIDSLYQLGIIGIPHVCGGDPKASGYKVVGNEYSPCMWG